MRARIENSSFRRVIIIEKEKIEEITNPEILTNKTLRMKLRNLVSISVRLDLQDSKMIGKKKKIKRNQRSS